MSRSAQVARGAIGLTAAVLCSVILLSWATDGMAVLTTDAARARRVLRAPVAVPSVSVRSSSSSGTEHEVLRDLTRESTAWTSSNPGSVRPRAVIVDFVYTRCITVCGALGGVFQVLQRNIEERGLQDKVRLLTVSFDVAHDDPRSLALYARVHRANSEIWSLVTPVDTSALAQLLRTFGVQVIPDGAGGWVHNAALHVVDPHGRLVRIVDMADGEAALRAALEAWDAVP